MGNDTAMAQLAMLDVVRDGAGGPSRVGRRVRWTDDDRAQGEAESSAPERRRLEHCLARAACLGDEGALEALCRHQWFGVYKLVSGSVADPIEAEEMVQDVFARAIARLSHFPYTSVSFRSYLFQIARRLLRDHWRDEDRASDRASVRSGDPVRPVRPLHPAAGAPLPETIVLAANQRRRLVAAMDRLPPRCREVLHLQLVEGRTVAEIGVEWGRTPEVVQRVQHEALVALRSELERRATR